MKKQKQVRYQKTHTHTNKKSAKERSVGLTLKHLGTVVGCQVLDQEEFRLQFHQQSR
eukprot:m.76210 g.76210  ORF g.76210 m.76210 type:complete len:57 (-) comp20582_c0_seq1:196-366(-)